MVPVRRVVEGGIAFRTGVPRSTVARDWFGCGGIGAAGFESGDTPAW